MTALLDAVREHAAAKPAAFALDDGKSLSWEQLATILPTAAAEMARMAEPGRPIATIVDHGVAAAVLDLALAEAGIPVLALPRYFTPEQIDHATAQAGATALISEARLSVTGTDPRLHVDAAPLNCPAGTLPPGTARITFSSGSTGTPKGICLSLGHQLRVAEAVVARLGLGHAGRHLPILPAGILLETVAGFYATVLAGGTYIALPSGRIGMAQPFRPDFAKMLETIEGERITSLILVPELLAGLVGFLAGTGRRLPLLTMVAVGGARIERALLDRAAALGLPVRQGYGLTECASVVTLDDGNENARGSVGRSLGVNFVSLADDGEIMLDGPLFLGTVGAPRSPGPLATGDIGRIDDDGRLWVLGRKSALIITSHGRNISPEWVEGRLTTQPAILQAMVRGDGRPSLDAVIVPASPNADVAGAVAAANATLPAYAQVGMWRLVPPFMPANGQLTGNGRLRRAAIGAAYPHAEPVGDRPFFDRLVDATREAQARFIATPQLQAGITGRISLRDYIAYLTQAFHHVSHTVPLMREARARLGHKPELVTALDDYIEEESGHEFWILNDIDAAGGNREAIEPPSPGTRAMVEHAYRTIREGNPAAFFGMVYVLEGTSTAMATHGASAVQASLGLPDGAFHYLTSHGSLDLEHMAFFERLMNSIDDPDDQAAIIAMANDMFRLFGGVFAGIELEASHAVA